LGLLAMLGVCVCTVLSAGSLVLPHGAAAGLRPDPPKLPQRPPPPAPPPPPASTTPAPAPAPVPPPAIRPPPAAVVQAAPKQAPAARTSATRQSKQARATSAVRAAAARARKRHLGLSQVHRSRAAKTVRNVPVIRRAAPAAEFGISSSKPGTAVLRGVVLPLLLVGVLLLGATLVPAEVLPWPERARMLVELRGEITFAGLGILAACAAVSLLLLFAF
jgi:hypothetical protein